MGTLKNHKPVKVEEFFHSVHCEDIQIVWKYGTFYVETSVGIM